MARPARAAAAVCLSVASLLLRRSAALEVQLDHRGLDPFLDSWRYNFNLEGQSEAVKSYFDPCQDDMWFPSQRLPGGNPDPDWNPFPWRDKSACGRYGVKDGGEPVIPPAVVPPSKLDSVLCRKSSSGCRPAASHLHATPIAWSVYRAPPTNASGHERDFAYIAKDRFHSGLRPNGWTGPDRVGTAFEGGGDPDFYVVLDLGSTCYLETLTLRNHIWQPEQYRLDDFSVAAADSPHGFSGAPIINGSMPGAMDTLFMTTVDLRLPNLRGRYARIDFLRYGNHSVGLSYLALTGECHT